MAIIGLAGQYTCVSSDDTHFYVGGDEGIDIISKQSHRSEGHIAFDVGINDIWAADRIFCYAATNDGIYKFEKPSQFKHGENFIERFSKDFRSNTFLSQEVLAIDGLNKDFIVAGTAAGVEVINPRGVFHSSQFSPVTSVTIIDSSSIVYGGLFGVAGKSGVFNSDWAVADFHMQSPTLTSNEVTGIDTVVDEAGEVLLAVSTTNGITLVNLKSNPLVSPIKKLYVSG